MWPMSTWSWCSAMPTRPSPCSPAAGCGCARSTPLVDAQRVRDLVAHRAHRVVRHVAVEGPVAGHRDELEVARLADADDLGDLRRHCAARPAAAVAAGDLELHAVHVDRVVPHRQVADADAHALAGAATSGSMAGNTLELKVQRSKSCSTDGSGARCPGAAPSCAAAARSRGRRAAGSPARGWMMNRPIMPIAICTISSACGWYMCVPCWRSVNS
jgi:hypothetical protein